MKYLITGGAGFIGSRIAEKLIEANHSVRVLDNLTSGNIRNLDSIFGNPNFEFIEGDIRDFKLCLSVSKDIDIIIHQAALVSVPKSIEVPIENNDINISGFVNILEAARLNQVKRVVYASSSAVYGENEDLRKVESRIGKPISPYALTKYVDELYAKLYSRVYNLETIGLRYFNVYGSKQDPSSVYSGVISVFMKNILEDMDLKIFGDGTVVRDFVFVDDVARANLLAARTEIAPGSVYNIGSGVPISIKELAEKLIKVANKDLKIKFLPARVGDILYSCANIDKAKEELNFSPSVKIEVGLQTIYNELLQQKDN